MIVDFFLQRYFRIINYGMPNFGISFGIWDGVGKSLAIIFFLVFCLWLWTLSVRKKQIPISLIFIGLGGFGNIIARVFSANVWDYIWLPLLPFWFNLSDVLISVGVLSYILGSNGDSSTI